MATKRPTSDPVEDENLAKNDLPKQAAAKGRDPVSGDAAADANPDGDSAVDKARAKNRSVPTAEKTPDKPKKGTPAPIEEPSGTLDAAERERENTEFKANTPPDRTPDKAEQKTNEAVGAMTTGTPQPAPAPGAGKTIAADEVGNLAGRADAGAEAVAPPVPRTLDARLERDRDAKRTPRQDALDDAADKRGTAEKPAATSEGDTDDGDGLTFRRRFHDSASGAAVDRFRREIVAGASGRVTRVKETITPPLNEPSNGGERDWTFRLELEDEG